jgi:hypothetical protein
MSQEIARRGYEHFKVTGELLAETLHPDFVWDRSKFRGWPERQAYPGIDGAMQFIADWTESWEAWALELDELRDAGDWVIMILRQRGRVYPGTFSEYQDPAEYRKPEYPNHKPLRGNYPGSYKSSASTTPAHETSSGFDWRAAGVGAAGMLGLILLLTAVENRARIARNRRHDVPLVVQIDDRPGVG